MYPATLEVIAKCQLNNNRKKVVIDTFAAGLRFVAGETYTIDLEQDFVKETEGSKFSNPAVTGLGTFTTNSTGPQVQTDTPSGTTVTNNTFITYTYDRLILAGNGNYELYKVGSPDTLLRTYNPSDSTANNTISGNQITLTTTGLIDAGETYYVLIDEGAVEDRDGLAAFGFDNDQEHRWTTAPSTNVDFPDLISLKVSLATLTCEGTKNANYEYGDATMSITATITTAFDVLYINIPAVTYQYTGMTENNPFSSNPVYIQNNLNSANRYTLQISIDNGSLNTETIGVTYSITNKTKAEVNTAIEDLEFYPLRDQTSNTTLGFTLIDYATSTTLQTKNVTISYSGSDSTETWNAVTIMNTNVGHTHGLPALYNYTSQSTVLSNGNNNLKYWYYSAAVRFLVVGGGGAGIDLGTGGDGGQVIVHRRDYVSGGSFPDMPNNIFRSESYINSAPGQFGSQSQTAGATVLTYKEYSGGSYTDNTWVTATGGAIGTTSGTKLTDGNGNTLAMSGGSSSTNSGSAPFQSGQDFFGGAGGQGTSAYLGSSYVGQGGRGYGRDNASLQQNNKFLTQLGSGGYGGSTSESPTDGKTGGVHIQLLKE